MQISPLGTNKAFAIDIVQYCSVLKKKKNSIEIRNAIYEYFVTISLPIRRQRWWIMLILTCFVYQFDCDPVTAADSVATLEAVPRWQTLADRWIKVKKKMWMKQSIKRDPISFSSTQHATTHFPLLVCGPHSVRQHLAVSVYGSFAWNWQWYCSAHECTFIVCYMRVYTMIAVIITHVLCQL